MSPLDLQAGTSFHCVGYVTGLLENKNYPSQLVLISPKPSITLLTFSHCSHILQLLHLLYVADGVQTNQKEEGAEVEKGGRTETSEEAHIFLQMNCRWCRQRDARSIRSSSLQKSPLVFRMGQARQAVAA